MHFDMKSYLKSTCNYTVKHALKVNKKSIGDVQVMSY
jgi:hypothetical protein